MLRRLMLPTLGILVSLTGCTSLAYALQPEPNAVFARVIDSGAALSVAIIMLGNHYMIYDAGNYTDDGSLTFKAIKEQSRKDL
jgi:hypothetical protein